MSFASLTYGNLLAALDWGLIVFLVLAGGLFGLLWWKGYLLRLATFATQTRIELRKCSWPTAEELKGSTVLVMVATAILGVLVVLIDQVFVGLVTWIIDASRGS